MPIPIDFFSTRYIELAQELRKYEELEIQVKQLTGYNFNCLFELFKRGYTLEPPNYEGTMSGLARLVDKENDE